MIDFLSISKNFNIETLDQFPTNKKKIINSTPVNYSRISFFNLNRYEEKNDSEKEILHYKKELNDLKQKINISYEGGLNEGFNIFVEPLISFIKKYNSVKFSNLVKDKKNSKVLNAYIDKIEELKNDESLSNKERNNTLYNYLKLFIDAVSNNKKANNVVDVLSKYINIDYNEIIKSDEMLMNELVEKNINYENKIVENKNSIEILKEKEKVKKEYEKISKEVMILKGYAN
jgi:hypothetical protein